MKENELRIDHLLFGFSIGAIASYMLLSSSFVSNESVYMLIIFNFLFVSLTFPLDGTLTRKISMLLIGNIIGLFWNLPLNIEGMVKCKEKCENNVKITHSSLLW